jgi:predicted acylesterase/phospholipase RssA
VLSLDGGGMRGLVTAHMLRHLERRLGGRPLSAFFDIIVGTSTGAIQAVSLGALRYTLDQCEGTYTKLGHKVGGKGRTLSCPMMRLPCCSAAP